MNDYIDRAGLMFALTNSEVQQKIKAMNWNDAYNEFLCMVNFISKADVAPIEHAEVRRGTWDILDGHKTRRVCSACGWDVPEYGKFYSYCPNCGAKMEDVEDE